MLRNLEESEWKEAYRRLTDVLGRGARLVPSAFYVIPDRVLEAADVGGLRREELPVRNPLRPMSASSEEDSPARRCVSTIRERFFRSRPPELGDVWVITDDAFVRGSPTRLASSDVLAWLSEHHEELDEDVVVIWLSTARLLVIHHSGAFYDLWR